MVILSGLMFMSSCGLFKKIFKKKPKQEESRTEVVMPIIGTIESRTQKVNTIQERLKVTMNTGGEEQTVTILLRYKRDSLLWFSVLGPMNIEVMRGIIRPDSFFVLNKFAKQVYYGSVSNLGNKYGITSVYNVINALLLGTIPKQTYKFEFMKDTLLLVDTAMNLTYGVNVNDTLLSRVYAFTGQSEYVLYIDEYKEVNAKERETIVLPSRWYMKTNGMELSIKQASVKVNHKLKFPFRIPDRYQKVPFNY